MNGINPFGGSGSGSDSNEVINSPFGPTIGPAQEVHTSPAISPTSSSSSTDTVKGPTSSRSSPDIWGSNSKNDMPLPKPKSLPNFDPYKDNEEFGKYFRDE